MSRKLSASTSMASAVSAKVGIAIQSGSGNKSRRSGSASRKILAIKEDRLRRFSASGKL